MENLMTEATQLKRELKLVTPKVDIDVRLIDEKVKAELIASMKPVLSKYGLVLVKANHTSLSDEISMHIRASIPDGLDQDCFTRDLLSFAPVFGYQSSILGRSIIRKNEVTGDSDRFVINGLDVIDRHNPEKNKFRVFNKENPAEVMLVDFHVVKSVFPGQFKR
jgi:hypothetical protein